MNHIRTHREMALRVGLATCFSLLATAVAAQTFPAKPIRIIAPFPAASVADVLARPIAQKMNETWGQPVIVDNRTGAADSAVLPHIRTGKMRLIAISAADRDPTMPEVPTIAETVSGFEMAPWFGLFGPAGTPTEVVMRLNTETVRILALPDVKANYQNLGLTAVSSTPEEFSGYVREEIVRWAKVVKASGARAD
jgi:tripartite-type tricarboxylate transporter receptor subunit TctC